ncbi:MAG: type II toxin-antitoxin system VapC family toxin [Bryobacteraceae bacterium]|nr:type II toxin-antitoxin system VapC family toxin [Bryobacteraceae bacterium]
MKGVLLDTDVLIEVLCGRSPEILPRFEKLATSDMPIFYTPVTVAEIWHGVRAGEERAVAQLLDSMACLPLDEETGRRAGHFLRLYRGSHSLELGDALIGAAAVQHNLPLWTRNRKHYPMKEIRFYGPGAAGSALSW